MRGDIETEESRAGSSPSVAETIKLPKIIKIPHCINSILQNKIFNIALSFFVTQNRSWSLELQLWGFGANKA